MAGPKRRIAVLGNAAGGKSTLSLELSRRLGVPYVSVDKALWRPGWRPAPPEEVARIHQGWMEEPGWVVDGWGDMALIGERLVRADAVVVVQHPLWRHCCWALKRQGAGILWGHSVGPDGCPLARKIWQLVKAMRWIHLYGMPELERRIKTVCRPDAVYRIRSPRQIEGVIRALAPDASASSLGFNGLGKPVH